MLSPYAFFKTGNACRTSDEHDAPPAYAHQRC